MLLDEFKGRIEELFESAGLTFNFYKGDDGGQWYSVKLDAGLLEVYIASDCEVGINSPSEDDEISFGGCDEVYDDFDIVLGRVIDVISG